MIWSQLVITRQQGYLLFVDIRTETNQKNVSGFELGPSGRQPGNTGKEGGQPGRSGCQGWQVLSPVILPLALAPLWSPGGMLAEPQNLPPLPLTFGNPLWWHFSPNKPWVSRTLSACPSCSPHSETFFSLLLLCCWEVLLIFQRPVPELPTMWISLQTLSLLPRMGNPFSSPCSAILPLQNKPAYMILMLFSRTICILFLLGPCFLLYDLHSLYYILTSHQRK